MMPSADDYKKKQAEFAARRERVMEMWDANVPSAEIAAAIGNVDSGWIRSVVRRARVAGDPRAVARGPTIPPRKDKPEPKRAAPRPFRPVARPADFAPNYRSFTAALMGDPEIGRSALDRRARGA